MKRTTLSLFFFMLLYFVSAQPQTDKHSPASSEPLDSIQFARFQLAEGLSAADKDSSKALPALKLAARLFKKNNLANEEGKCHMTIADIYFEAGQYNRAFANYVRAQDIFYEVSQTNLALATLGVAKSQYHRGLYRFAIKNFSEVIEFSVKNNDDQLKASAAEYLGMIFLIFQSNSQSKAYFTSAFIANSKLNDDKGSLRIAEKLFSLHYMDRQFDSALWYSNFSLALAEKLKQNNTVQSSQLNRIAALVRLKRLDEAKQELRQFAETVIPQSDLNARIRYEALSGNYLMAQNQNEKAISQYDSAIKHASATNTTDLQALVYSHMADAYAEQHDYEKAYRYSLKYFAMMNEFYNNSISYLSKIESLIKEDVADSRIKYLNSINKIKELQLLRELDMRQNLQNENTLKDSLLQKEKQLGIALGLENKYKSQELGSQQQRSALLNKESQLQKKELQREFILRSILIAALACLLFLGALSWYNYKRAKTKNLIIEKQAAELQILMKEIHHRVKNNLQIISSLLDIQSLNLDNPAALAIREGKNRVQSMAIIHQFLYHEDNIRGIRVEDYIKTLSENLFSSYNVDPENIKLETDIDQLNLDVDTMIPLGLIINELVSNSLKYAFNGKGKLFISLKEKEDCLHLLVRDDGTGFPSKTDQDKKQSFGLQLIAAFAQKLKAKLELYNDHGAVVYMIIKKYKLA